MYKKIIELDTQVIGYRNDLLNYLLEQCNRTIENSKNDFKECETQLINIIELMKEIKEYKEDALLRVKVFEMSSTGYVVEELQAI